MNFYFIFLSFLFLASTFILFNGNNFSWHFQKITFNCLQLSQSGEEKLCILKLAFMLCVHCTLYLTNMPRKRYNANTVWWILFLQQKREKKNWKNSQSASTIFQFIIEYVYALHYNVNLCIKFMLILWHLYPIY